jgi:hypothetical protein
LDCKYKVDDLSMTLFELQKILTRFYAGGLVYVLNPQLLERRHVILCSDALQLTPHFSQQWGLAFTQYPLSPYLAALAGLCALVR